jgi:hypothetical protein
MSFGRKGLMPGETAPAPARPATRGGSEAAEIAARREAFLAEERARRAAEADPADPLAHLRNGVRPATRRDEPAGHDWKPLSETEVQRARAAGIGNVRANPDKRFIFGEPHQRSLTLAYLFWFIAGQVSLHRFYCGQSQSAFMQIGLLVGSLLIGLIFVPMAIAGLFFWCAWIIVDLFLMPGMMRRFKAEHSPYDPGIFA